MIHMYTIKDTLQKNIFRVYLHEDCEPDIHTVCLELLPLFDEGKGAEYVVESDTVATIAYF